MDRGWGKNAFQIRGQQVMRRCQLPQSADDGSRASNNGSQASVDKSRAGDDGSRAGDDRSQVGRIHLRTPSISFCPLWILI